MDGEEQKVWKHRYVYARELGFEHVDAEILAVGAEDLHHIDDWLEAGCSHDLALRIALDIPVSDARAAARALEAAHAGVE